MNESPTTLGVRIGDLEKEITELERRLETGKAPPPREAVHEREIAGTIEEEGLEEMVSLLRREYGSLGEMERVGRTLTWTLRLNASAGVTRPVAVTIDSRGGRTRIRLSEDLQHVFANQIAGWTVGVGILGTLLLVGLLVSINPGLAALGLVSPFITHQVAKSSYRKAAAEAERRGSDVMDKLATIAREMAVGGVRVADSAIGDSAIGEPAEESTDEKRSEALTPV